MNTKDLFDEASFDPGKLFDKEQYITFIIDREGFSKKEEKVADLLEALLNKDINRPEAEEIFSTLKGLNAQDIMMDAIRQAGEERDKALLIAGCWESGLDFTPHFMYFVELATSAQFSVALEALTVVQECGTVANKTLQEALAFAEKSDAARDSLASELTLELRSRLGS